MYCGGFMSCFQISLGYRDKKCFNDTKKKKIEKKNVFTCVMVNVPKNQAHN